MKHIIFEYKDELSHGEWNKQECYLPSLDECIKCYGLDQPDVDYHIISVEDVDN